MTSLTLLLTDTHSPGPACCTLLSVAEEVVKLECQILVAGLLLTRDIQGPLLLQGSPGCCRGKDRQLNDQGTDCHDVTVDADHCLGAWPCAMPLSDEKPKCKGFSHWPACPESWALGWLAIKNSVTGAGSFLS